ncbi:hypothetical protein [Cryptosporangium phraense]|uniref:Uncharacterized protein n=1 Tax=Cryptosporangium phraense TaxID=2593070 RepID=A0A545ALJ5_9ACTN|nr:hypothetical protein [Cryptosporangium phraense]TQS42198.1 hypothetical protein FL583_24985 [Cryptosporangium phraense]
MTEVSIARVGFALRLAGWRRRASRWVSASAAWARAERHAFFAPPTAGAFHGEPRREDGYLTAIRSTWGRP